jgi:hypothetical protein
MSTHHEIECEQEHLPQAAPLMPVQEARPGEAVPLRQPSPPSPRPPGRRWFTAALVAIVVLLVVSVGVVIAVQLSQPLVTPATPTPIPTATGVVTTTPVRTSTTQPTLPPTGHSLENRYYRKKQRERPSHLPFCMVIYLFFLERCLRTKNGIIVEFESCKIKALSP